MSYQRFGRTLFVDALVENMLAEIKASTRPNRPYESFPAPRLTHAEQATQCLTRADDPLRSTLANRTAPDHTATEADRTLTSIATMLGWGNVPPRHMLESEIAALKARAKRTDHTALIAKLEQAQVYLVDQEGGPSDLHACLDAQEAVYGAITALRGEAQP